MWPCRWAEMRLRARTSGISTVQGAGNRDPDCQISEKREGRLSSAAVSWWLVNVEAEAVSSPCGGNPPN